MKRETRREVIFLKEMRAEIDVRGWLERGRKQVKAKLTQRKENDQD